ncbi:biotin--[acetyl-CoA-carboxylase] ligase [Herbaspirillum sp. RTI4]|uniref:biotin--[acetyl-CoA-carboxylase] ligase n=1 Tax=Herbaspirillum sp. RTI4 TaxID=3048640 RepID=UPI002AB3403B|nr:biotin--[acetyl-CoA-carboxylase] ligase [Herbaspirillum sp. RTI4]MDY7576942.1 biotin--[acetyl-CoA-carboxylase] ligase [Herbaspirillum sp. RTI4]MEA9982156.1 biotin--[acetyl-CoA-carboxylase] ligase [Herbaspirillum sp. RTI4]
MADTLPPTVTPTDSAARIAAHYALLAQSARQAGLLPDIDIDIRTVAETGSTNVDLMTALPGLLQPTLLLAHSQTAGRGRAGRVWHAESGAALTFSLAWRLALPLSALAGLPLAVGVALVDALADTLALQGVHARLKWPNDILLDGAKLGGVLIETASVKSAVGQIWAVIGVGLNLTLSDAQTLRIGRAATGAASLQSMEREALMAAILHSLVLNLRQFEAEGFAGFAARWNHLHAYAGQAVDIIDNGKTLYSGLAQGVDSAGRLLLNTAQGQIAVIAGDVSLRLQEAS